MPRKFGMGASIYISVNVRLKMVVGQFSTTSKMAEWMSMQSVESLVKSIFRDRIMTEISWRIRVQVKEKSRQQLRSDCGVLKNLSKVIESLGVKRKYEMQK